MKSLLLSTYEDLGGASLAAKRLLSGLKNIGADAQMYVQVKNTDDPSILTSDSKLYQSTTMVRDYADSAPLIFYKKPQKIPWCVGWLPYNISKKINQIKPDIINIHRINGGFFPLSQLKKIKKPVVITLHDMWTFTGGCCYNENCEKYKSHCGACPELNSKFYWDLSYFLFERKRKCLENQNIEIISPSRWLADCAQNSTLLKEKKIHVIPNGVDLTVYKPINQRWAREILNLRQEKKFILFGAIGAASLPRKGFRYLQSALQNLPLSVKSNCELLTFGDTLAPKIDSGGIPHHNLGKIDGEIALSLMYSAADVYISPATQEAFGLTVLESMACGTPVVAFNTGGARDIIEHKSSGYLANMFDATSLASGIEWCLSNNENGREISQKCRSRVEAMFDINLVAQKYYDIYSHLSENK
ncbi:MAG: glycosyltransferase family 4 protein [Methanoregula sp.]|jgi:glycosyltransferase involved in cell wall biosynthesis|uniref:glycosyltransferase family 4 protein n=1 Tax=Methanoregula sp. TaxID=2052170 RepID=UPI0025D11A69|nr:glycosyltransferase family 4 protein [Methanoregula sp.]MCK9630272.1 glycosyltransferase family 4 protein [Methanoregula sp.]